MLPPVGLVANGHNAAVGLEVWEVLSLLLLARSSFGSHFSFGLMHVGCWNSSLMVNVLNQGLRDVQGCPTLMAGIGVTMKNIITVGNIRK